MPSQPNTPPNTPPATVTTVTTTAPSAAAADPALMQHGPIDIPQQPGMPPPIKPKAMGGVSYPNDRVTDASKTPLVPGAAAKAERELAPKKGTKDDPSAEPPAATPDEPPNADRLGARR